MRNDSFTEGCDASTIEVIYSSISIYDDLLISMDDCSTSSYTDEGNTRDTSIRTEDSYSAIFTNSYYEYPELEEDSDDEEDDDTFGDEISVSDILTMLESSSDSSETGWFSNLQEHLAEEHLTEKRSICPRNKPVVLSIIRYKSEAGDVEENENKENKVGMDKDEDEEERDDEEEHCSEGAIEQSEEKEERDGEEEISIDEKTETGIEAELSDRLGSACDVSEAEKDIGQPIPQDGTRQRGRSRRPRSLERSGLISEAVSPSHINSDMSAAKSIPTVNTKNSEPISIIRSFSTTKQGSESVATEATSASCINSDMSAPKSAPAVNTKNTEPISITRTFSTTKQGSESVAADAISPSGINSHGSAAESTPTANTKNSDTISITSTFSTIKQGIESVATWSKRDMQVIVIEDCDTEEMDNHVQETSAIAPQAIELSSTSKLQKSLMTVQDLVLRKRRVLERRLGMEYGLHRRLFKKQNIRQYLHNGHVNIGAIIADIRMVETLQAIYKFVHERQTKIKKKMAGEYEIHKRLMKNKKKKGVEKPSIKNMRNKFLKAQSTIRREIHESNIVKNIQKMAHHHQSKKTEKHQHSYTTRGKVPSHRCIE